MGIIFGFGALAIVFFTLLAVKLADARK